MKDITDDYINITDYKGINAFQLFTLSERIKVLTKVNGKTLKDLASAVGISEQGIHSMLRRGMFKTEVLQKIAKELNEPIQIFYQFDDIAGKTRMELLEHEISTYSEKVVEYLRKIEQLENKISELNELISFLQEIDIIDFEKFKKEGQFPWPPDDLITTFPISSWISYFTLLTLKSPGKKKHLLNFYDINKLVRYGKLNPKDPDIIKLLKKSKTD